MGFVFKFECALNLKHTSAMASTFDNAIGRGSKIEWYFADAQSRFYDLHVLMAAVHVVKVVIPCYTLFVSPPVNGRHIQFWRCVTADILYHNISDFVGAFILVCRTWWTTEEVMRPAHCSNHTSECAWRRVDSSTYRTSSSVALRMFATPPPIATTDLLEDVAMGLRLSLAQSSWMLNCN